jgi:hypothetical protein
MYTDAQIFVWDVDDLTEILKNPTDRNLLQAAAILRRLFMDDGTPLVHKVASAASMKLEFDIFDVDPSSFSRGFPEEGLIFVYENPDPSIVDNARTRKVKLDKFLALKAVFSRGSYISLGDVIRYCANVAGGVHRGAPKNKNNAKEIHEQASAIILNGLPYPAEVVRNVVSMSMTGLKPIYDRLRA